MESLLKRCVWCKFSANSRTTEIVIWFYPLRIWLESSTKFKTVETRLMKTDITLIEFDRVSFFFSSLTFIFLACFDTLKGFCDWRVFVFFWFIVTIVHWNPLSNLQSFRFSILVSLFILLLVKRIMGIKDAERAKRLPFADSINTVYQQDNLKKWSIFRKKRFEEGFLQR